MIPRTWADDPSFTKADTDVLDSLSGVGVDPHPVLPELVGVVAAMGVLVRRMRERGYKRYDEIVTMSVVQLAVSEAFAVADTREVR